MKTPVETVEPEPIYEYVKGQGWVINHTRPFPHNDHSLLCNRCGKRAGLHRAEVYNCPDLNWNTYLESKWA